MARIPRLYRVHAAYRNGDTATRHYQTPEAAEARRERFEQGRTPALSQEAADTHRANGTEAPRDVPTVTVTPSYPVTYPRALGDSLPFEIPDSLVAAEVFLAFIRELGISPEAFRSLRAEGNEILVEIDADKSKKHAPRTWRVEIVEEN